MSDAVLLGAVVVECVLFGLLLTTLVAELVLARSGARRASAVAAARAALARALHGEAPDGAAPRALRALPPREALALLVELADSVGGEAYARVLDVAEEAGLPGRARRLCASRSWARRLPGIRALSRLHAQTGDVVATLLDDRVGAVAAAAADAVDGASEPKLFERLVVMLDDRRPECRFAAKAALAAAGAAATPVLVRYLQSAGCPRPADALEAATGRADLRLLQVALDRAADPEPAVRARAAALLGAVGSSPASERLQTLLVDPDPQVRAAAPTALGALGDWGPAGEVAALLGDPEWKVRRSAALALHAMGPPGRLYLRRAASSEGAAADSARSVLGPPENAIETLLA